MSRGRKTGAKAKRGGYRHGEIAHREIPTDFSNGWITSVDRACSAWLRGRGLQAVPFHPTAEADRPEGQTVKES